MGANLGTAVGYLELNTSKWESGIKTAQSQLQTLTNSTSSMSSKFSAAGSVMTSVGSTLTKAVTLPIAGIAAASVKTAADFEASMSEVKAITGATGSDFTKLENQAKQLGSSTKFSASEAAEGMKYFGMAGYDTNQIMAAMPATLDLAAASGESLGTTCDIVSDAMTGFKMSAEETAHFSDILAAASTSSNTNVSLMGETFKYVAPLCGTMGYSAEDASLAIGLMANAGIKGSQAGTSLKTAISNMISPTKSMQGVMDQLGISMTNSDGTTKSLRDVMGQLREKFATLTPAQQASAAATLFGKEAMSGMLAIITASDEEYNGLANAIDNCDGRASEMAATMQDNLSGQLTNLKSALEGAAISIGNAMLPMIKALVAGIQGLVNWFNNLSPGMQQFIVIAGLIAAAIGPVLLIFGALASAIGSIISIAGALGIGVGALVGIFSGVGVAIAAVIAIGALLITHWDQIKSTASNVWNGIKTTIGNAVNGIVTFFQQLPGKIGNFLTTAWNNAKKWATNMWNTAKEMGSKFVENASNFIKNLPEKIAYYLAFAVTKAALWVVNMAAKAKQAGTQFVNNVVNFIKNLPSKVATFLTNTISKVTSWATNMASKARTAGTNFINNIVNTIRNLPSRVASFLSQTISRISSFVSQMGSKARQAAQTFGNNIKSGLAALPGQMVSIGRNIIQGLINGVTSAAGALASKMKSIAQSALAGAKAALGIKSPSRKFRDEVGKWIPLGIAEGIENNSKTLYSTLNNMANNMVTDFPTDDLLIGYGIGNSNSISNKGNSSNSNTTNLGSLLNVNNLTINKDVEELANDLAFYLKRKGYAF